MDLVFVLSLAIISILWKNLSETVNSRTFYLSFLETQSMVEIHPFISPFFSRLITTALENFEYIWDVETSMIVLLCVLSGFQVLFKNKKLLKNINQWSALKPDGSWWQGVWESMGKCQRLWALPVFQNSILEQVQNLEKLVKYLEKVSPCHPGKSRETKITAKCWAVAKAFQALSNHIHYPQGEEKVSGSDNKTTSHVPTPGTGTAAEPEHQLVPLYTGKKCSHCF